MSGIIGRARSKSGLIGTLMGDGDWEDLDFDTIYLATRDLFIVAFAYADGANGLAFYTDSAQTPTTIRARAYDGTGGLYNTVSGVVKKGDYWKVYLQTGTGTGPFAISLH